MRRTLGILCLLLLSASAAIAQGTINTVAGNGLYGFGPDGVLATSSRLASAVSVAFDSVGNMFISDSNNCRIRRVDVLTGVISTVAGYATCGYAGEGFPATSSNGKLYYPWGITFDSAGNLFITEPSRCTIRRVAAGADGLVTGAADEIITTVAGTGFCTYNGDNRTAKTATLYYPYAMAFDLAGNLFVADSQNFRIRRIAAGVDGLITGASDEIITTVAGGSPVFGDNIPATTSRVGPYGVAFDSAGNLFINDTGSFRVRRVSTGADGLITGASDEIITTVAGTGAPGFNGDNISARTATINYAYSMASDSSGNLYFADTYNQRIRRVSSGADGLVTGAPDEIITTVAGTGVYGYNGDSIPATSAQISYPYGVAFKAGSLLIADFANNRIRRVGAADSTPPEINCTVPNASVWYGADVTVNCTASDAGSGLANSGDASFSLTTSVAAGSESASAQTNTRSICDNANNCANAGPYTFKVDKKAPQQSSCDAADGAWHGSDVTLHCTYTDGGSGPASQQVALSTSVASGTETANAAASAGGAQACDAVGNCAASPADITGNKVDKQAPSVTCGAADGVWHASNVSINCTATDGGSGPASQNVALTSRVAAGTENANASTNSVQLCDAVNNCSTAGPVGGNMIDRKAPSISISSPVATSYLLNQSTASSYGCSDGGSGSASCSGPVASGSNFDTASVGAKSFTVTATDNVGNFTSSAVSYTVNYAAAGICFGATGHAILQPVNVDGSSVFKQGSTVPAKFRVCDANGNSVGAAGVVASFNLVQTMSGTVVATVNEPVDSTTPDPNFRWDASAMQWIFNISTKPLTKNVTYFYRATLNDGTAITFNFGLK